LGPSSSRQVPRGFATEASQAAARKDVARLGLLASEASGFLWEVAGWRTVGKMLLDIHAWSAARRTLERIRHVDATDRDADLWLGTVDRQLSDLAASRQALGRVRAPHVVVFTGHMVDGKDRTPPRFPESCVAAARQQMWRRLEELQPTVGIAAAASGGDILFHEVCAELGIPTDLRLALPPEQFVKESVVGAGAPWVQRFWALVERKQREHRYAHLGEDKELPEWLQDKPDYNLWARANLWVIEAALNLEPGRLTVMALWDGEASDGPGGTADLLDRATQLGATPLVIDTHVICRAD
jgi:hypothetical protein